MEPGAYEYSVLRGGGCLKKMKKRLWRDSVTADYVKTMYARGDQERKLQEIHRQRILVVLVLFLAVVAAWLYCYFSEPEEDTILSTGGELVRQQDDTNIQLQITGQSEMGNWHKSMTFLMKTRRFSDDEKKELTGNVKAFVLEKLLQNNTSEDRIENALVFITKIPDTDIELHWSFDDTYIRKSGSLIRKNIPEDGVDTDVMLKAAWLNWKKTYHFRFHLIPKPLSAKQQQIRQVKEEVKQALKSHPAEKVVKLPLKIGDMQISYQTPDKGKSFGPVYIVIFGMIMLPFLWKEQQKKQLQEREEQMMTDHPGIVNRIMLLLGAGLTVRGAMERLAKEYEETFQQNKKIRYAYEEICVLSQEMRDGMSEAKALERFGKRCRLLPYLRFSSVIAQNLKKGSEGLLDILQEEAMEAWEQRKQRALQMGEKAGTKLLLPMILMLGLVMALIMIPAFMSM